MKKNEEIKELLNRAISDIYKNYRDDGSVEHISRYPIPSKNTVILIIDELFDILFPGYFTEKRLDETNIEYYLTHKVAYTYELLSAEIAKSFRHEEHLHKDTCDLCENCITVGTDTALLLLQAIPELRDTLAKDIEAAFSGDPAAKSLNEIVFSYPGIFSITVHRLAHFLHIHDIPLIPRIMSEYAHSKTGIDIHPGAKIGEYFFIDHGTGVVIGETCIIGDNVKIYQGVTLGALSFPKDEKGMAIKGLKRHPTIEDGVTIYSGATILGGETVIGKNSIVGGNVWLVESIPADSKVTLEESQRKITIKNRKSSNR